MNSTTKLNKEARKKLDAKNKRRIMELMSDGVTRYTQQVATPLGLKWSLTDRLLRSLVNEGKLFGDKRGYNIEAEEEVYEPAKPTLWGKIRDALHV